DDKGQLLIISDHNDPICLTQYGFSKISKYCLTDDKREFIKIPLDPNQKQCVKLEEILTKMDDHIKNNQDLILKDLPNYSKSKHLYEYQPLVKKPMEILTEDDETNKKIKYNSVNVKFDIDKEN